MANNIPPPFSGGGGSSGYPATPVVSGAAAAGEFLAATSAIAAAWRDLVAGDIPGTLNATTIDGALTTATDAGVLTVSNAADNSIGNATVLVENTTHPAQQVFVGQNDGSQYSNFILADNVYPIDAAGHYWAFSHRNSHSFWIFNYNGSVYKNIFKIQENGVILTINCVLDDGAGNIDCSGLQVVESGAKPKQGVATLTAGTVTVSNTGVTTSSRIFLTAQDNSSTGALRVSARVASTSFTITSSNAGDSGVVAYEIFEPG